MVRLGGRRLGRRLDPAYRGGGKKKYEFLFLKIRALLDWRLEGLPHSPLQTKKNFALLLSHVW